MCDQRRLRPACAYAQSDQSLCLSLEYSMSVKLLTEHHLEFLSLKGGCTGSSESILVKMPHCWKSHVMAHVKHKYFAQVLYFVQFYVIVLAKRKYHIRIKMLQVEKTGSCVVILLNSPKSLSQLQLERILYNNYECN